MWGKGDYDQKIGLKKGLVNKVKNKGKTEVMELIAHIMANPFSTQGALLSHSSPNPPWGGPG